MVLSNVGKVALVLFVASAAMFIVGFSLPYWAVIDKLHFGLWESCIDDYCTSTLGDKFTVLGDDLPSWFRATQALACLALIAVIADSILRLLFIWGGQPVSYLIISIVCDFAACVLANMAASVFGDKMDEYENLKLHIGFALTATGALFLGITGVCFLVEYCYRHRRR